MKVFSDLKDRLRPSSAPSRWFRFQEASRWVAPVVSVGAATALTIELRNVLDLTPSFLHFSATAIAVWIGGFRSGIMATALSALAMVYYARMPLTLPDVSIVDIGTLALLLVVGASVSFVIRRQRITRQRYRQLSTQLENEAGLRGITVITDLPEELPPVAGDYIQPEEVLLNIIVNGMGAMNCVEDGRKKLVIRGRQTTWEGRPSVTISVEDSGSGLPKEETDRMFDAFYTTKREGMGVGLALGRAIIEAHGGQIWAEPSGRSIFPFCLPTIRDEQA